MDSNGTVIDREETFAHREETLVQLMRTQAERLGDAPAVIYGETTTGFAELREQSRRVAARLAALGVEPGDRVALWLPNIPAYLVMYLACTELGAIAVAVNTRFRALEVADIVSRSGSKVLANWPGFRGIDFLGILQAIDKEALASLEHIVLYGEDEDEPELPPVVGHCNRVRYDELVAEGAPALTVEAPAATTGSNIFTTSGTTSKPKFVLHTQGSIVRHGRALTERLGGIIDGSPQLLVLPLCGVFGFTQATMALAAGLPSVMMTAFDPIKTVALIDRYEIRYLNATDDMIEALLEVDKRDKALPSIVCCGYGSFNTDPESIMTLAEGRNLKLIGLYGMSEIQALFAMQSPDMPRETRMLGGGTLVSGGAEVRVRDVETGEIKPDGEEGEIEVRGPSLFRAYFQNEQATAAAFTDDGFLRTGDMGYTLGPRSFVFLARMGDVLRLGGFLVSPVEIESYLQDHAAVDGCQVVSVTASGRARAVAFVTLTAGHDLDEDGLIAYCKDGMAGYKVPVRVFAIDEFPVTRSANGTKIQRAKLRKWAVEWLDAE